MRIAIDRDPGYAPCSYLLCGVDDEGDYSTRDDDSTILFDSDWSFPSLAGLYGYVPCPDGLSDGTVDCGHGTASEHIKRAQDWMDERLGTIVDSDEADEWFETSSPTSLSIW